MPAAITCIVMVLANVAGFVTQQGHAFYAQGSNGHFAFFARRYKLIVFVEQFYIEQFGVVVSALAGITFGKRGLHFSGRIGRIQLDMPLLRNLLAQNIQ